MSEKKIAINIFPNPANNSINITCSNFDFNAIVITDLLGKEIPSNLLLSTSNGDTVNINISKLLPGVYFLKINSELKRFIKV